MIRSSLRKATVDPPRHLTWLKNRADHRGWWVVRGAYQPLETWLASLRGSRSSGSASGTPPGLSRSLGRRLTPSPGSSFSSFLNDASSSSASAASSSSVSPTRRFGERERSVAGQVLGQDDAEPCSLSNRIRGRGLGSGSAFLCLSEGAGASLVVAAVRVLVLVELRLQLPDARVLLSGELFRGLFGLPLSADRLQGTRSVEVVAVDVVR